MKTDRSPDAGQTDGTELALRSGDGGWLVFRGPKRIIAAADVSEIGDCLRLAGESAADGAWVAGFVAYEAAPGLDPALVAHPQGRVGLLWLGVFDAPIAMSDLPSPDGTYSITEWEVSPERSRYIEAANRVLSYLRAGDTYQVNLSVRFRAGFDGDPYALFRDLWRAQPTPYGAFMRIGDTAICSVSPELFFESDGETLRSRPMKGTAKRGLWFEDDERSAEALRGSAKDRAENVMIVDMIRNDLGRVAEPGTVRVASLFDVERHPSVFQMTSTVECRSKAGIGGVFRALFPCSSITGAPKVRTMQIIRELEQTPRGVYCGAIGFAHDRSMRFSVAIRTVVVDLARGTAEYGAGGGIVFDSTPEKEFEECRVKARVLAGRTPEFMLLETLRWSEDDGFFLLDRHIRRMGHSAAYFGFRFDPDALRRRLDSLSASLGRAPRKMRLTAAADGTVSVEVAALPDPGGQAVRVGLAARAIDAGDKFLYHKTTNRAAYDRARSGLEDVEDVLLYNAAGEATESTIANIVVETGGRMLTPPIRCGLLAGTMRDQIIEEGIVEEGVVRVEELFSADSLWLVNSVRGWRRAELVRR